MPNLFTPLKTVHRLDYFGNLYTTSVIDDRQPDLGKLWSDFAQRFTSQPTRDISGQHREIGRRLEERGERELYNKENNKI